MVIRLLFVPLKGKSCRQYVENSRENTVFGSSQHKKWIFTLITHDLYPQNDGFTTVTRSSRSQNMIFMTITYGSHP